jgi:hypothetical protein
MEFIRIFYQYFAPILFIFSLVNKKENYTFFIANSLALLNFMLIIYSCGQLFGYYQLSKLAMAFGLQINLQFIKEVIINNPQTIAIIIVPFIYIFIKKQILIWQAITVFTILLLQFQNYWASFLLLVNNKSIGIFDSLQSLHFIPNFMEYVAWYALFFGAFWLLKRLPSKC